MKTKPTQITELFGSPMVVGVTKRQKDRARKMALKRFGHFYGAQVAMGDGYVIPLRLAFMDGVITQQLSQRAKS